MNELEGEIKGIKEIIRLKGEYNNLILTPEYDSNAAERLRENIDRLTVAETPFAKIQKSNVDYVRLTDELMNINFDYRQQTLPISTSSMPVSTDEAKLESLEQQLIEKALERVKLVNLIADYDLKYLTVPKGQFTFNQEGQEKEGAYFSRIAQKPSRTSGFTLGRGYDMKDKTKNQVTEFSNSSSRSNETDFLFLSSLVYGYRALPGEFWSLIIQIVVVK